MKGKTKERTKRKRRFQLGTVTIRLYDYPYKSAGIVRFIGHLLWYNRHEQSEKGMKVHVETEMQAD